MAHGEEPSKKQTPFSVWYRTERDTPRRLLRSPQRSRRLSASGIDLPPGTKGEGAYLKEADAFQRLVYAGGCSRSAVWRDLKEADAFQRLVS